uniref:Uncharacterized protein n=1 Tax=Anguilla anguilla TaxID=7936 RepID=A0A0E9WDD8_ANGAN
MLSPVQTPPHPSTPPPTVKEGECRRTTRNCTGNRKAYHRGDKPRRLAKTTKGEKKQTDRSENSNSLSSLKKTAKQKTTL